MTVATVRGCLLDWRISKYIYEVNLFNGKKIEQFYKKSRAQTYLNKLRINMNRCHWTSSTNPKPFISVNTTFSKAPCQFIGQPITMLDQPCRLSTPKPIFERTINTNLLHRTLLTQSVPPNWPLRAGLSNERTMSKLPLLIINVGTDTGTDRHTTFHPTTTTRRLSTQSNSRPKFSKKKFSLLLPPLPQATTPIIIFSKGPVSHLVVLRKKRRIPLESQQKTIWIWLSFQLFVCLWLLVPFSPCCGLVTVVKSDGEGRALISGNPLQLGVGIGNRVFMQPLDDNDMVNGWLQSVRLVQG